MSSEVLERVNRACNPVDRMTRTEASRGNWVDRLNESGVIEVLDRNQTCGYLVARETLAEINETIVKLQERCVLLEDALQEEMDRADVAQLVAERGNHERRDWSGISDEEAMAIVNRVLAEKMAS